MSSVPWNRTKIVCTLGPATDAPNILRGMIAAGMDVARINTSHGAPAEHERRIHAVRAEARHAGQSVAILIDLPGPKFRLGRVPGGVRNLAIGERVALAASANAGSNVLPLRNRRLLAALRPGQPVYLSDGSVRLRVRRVAGGRADCEVIAGGTVRSGSGVNLPESKLAATVPTAEDRRQIQFAVAQRAEWIGISFVESADDVLRVRRLLPEKERPLLIAKIERGPAVAQLPAILEAADGVMVARGDLGVETDIAEIPILQKRIIRMANGAARPVITATQMLESMVEQDRPTRAEVTDIANAVLDGTDCVMLSGETAIGRSPVRAVETMRRVIAATESEYGDGMPVHPMGYAACELAGIVGAKGIVALVSSVSAVSEIARFRPAVPVLVATESERVARSVAVIRGVEPLRLARGASSRGALNLARKWLRSRRLASPGDTLVVIEGHDSRSDTLRLIAV